MRANHQKSYVIILIFDDLLAYKFPSTTTSSPFPYTSRCPKMEKVSVFGHLYFRLFIHYQHFKFLARFLLYERQKQ